MRAAILTISIFLITAHVSIAEKTTAVIDTIIATVDDRPITLLELGRRLSPPRTLTRTEASSNHEAKLQLQTMILEQMLIAEAERRNIKVADDDINRYVAEVKSRNNLTDEQFQKTLQQERKSLSEYREQVRIDILKSKIASNFIKSSAAVTEADIDRFIRQGTAVESGVSSTNGAKVHIRQIFLPHTDYTAEEARSLSAMIHAKLKDGASFSSLAQDYSKGSEAAEGGDMGIINEKDLSPDIFDTLVTLKEGDVSHLVSAPQGFFLYQLVERISTDAQEPPEESPSVPEVSPELRAKIRQKLEQEKMQSKMISYIEQELPKQHTVEIRM